MSIHRNVRVAVAGTALMLGACAPAVRSQRDEAIPVPQGATWAWASADTAEGTAIPRQRLRRAVEAAMVARGFPKTSDSSSAEFLLALTLGGGGRRASVAGRDAASVGFVVVGGGWGRRGGWGWGPYRAWIPWGWYQPWGFGLYGVPMWGFAPMAVPYYAPSSALVATLRRQADGEVAWQARYRADVYDLRYMTQRHAQEIAEKLMATLR